MHQFLLLCNHKTLFTALILLLGIGSLNAMTSNNGTSCSPAGREVSFQQCKYDGSEIKKETIAYDGELLLDRYYCNDAQEKCPTVDKKSPAMIFMFGGAFYTGSRDRKDYIPYFHYLAKHGIQVFSIDYRLGLKPLVEKMQGSSNTSEQESPAEASNKKEPGKLAAAKMLITLLGKSIDMAVEDLYKATAFIISNAERWNIDTALIMTSGSSAGAITALQAEYYLSNQASSYLPSGFKYAGVISFAGAILNLKDKMRWEKSPAPMMLFHGNADANVPYERIWTPMGCFNGSKYISQQLSKMDAPHYFYTYEEANHSIALTPMLQNLPEILGFIEDYVYSNKQYITNTIVEQPFAPKLKKRLRIKDYIKANL